MESPVLKGSGVAVGVHTAHIIRRGIFDALLNSTSFFLGLNLLTDRAI